MIDLHCHILPQVDDGARDDDTALAMARIAVSDGIRIMACTPHIKSGIYENTFQIIDQRRKQLQKLITRHEIKLKLVNGADVHIAANLAAKLSSGEFPCLGPSNYFLLEPHHQILPPKFEQFCTQLQAAGFVPVITHPERLVWIENNYRLIEQLSDAGIVMQITAGAFTGRFGKRPQYWSQKMLDDGRVDLVASDAHNTKSRPPILSEAREFVRQKTDENTAQLLFLLNPARILKNEPIEKTEQYTGQLSAKKPGPLGSIFNRKKS